VNELVFDSRINALNEKMRTAGPSERAKLERDRRSLTIRKDVEMGAIHEGMPKEEVIHVLQRWLQEMRTNPEITQAKRHGYEERIQRIVKGLSDKER
jgi:hypothetical protein